MYDLNALQVISRYHTFHAVSLVNNTIPSAYNGITVGGFGVQSWLRGQMIHW